ncbi:DUF7115 domain-containing protein [Halalkalicoccus jeotgali]|uniref:DUF7115 domain-containing protein n=1 Tax=Halalkalicoccus jeotgali (strain DSM 18796 / CECT 7217 / JCM 14584 / KCTC 4019 / B3) TaxID=795797 RepID=D8J833_HALJB|nr:hypothetical protein [Halalkalicoccus jeotgali]ADJ14146.1 hypothetical protein HacjB3_03775 [Halalkalicoccus jeotgali B3]ELY34672.1 hypothetical protein C497_15518 [Halalkalicoccus jeotgali B3]
MSRPELVRSALDGESVVARVPLRDDDALFVSPTRTLRYRSRSLLSDESVDEFSHAVERISLSAGRRKTTIELDYGLEGSRELAVPAERVEAALHPILAGVLSAAGLTDPGETVHEPFRFSELTLVVTDDRLIKHVGRAVWDEEFEQFRFADVEGLALEEGRVATGVVLTVSGRVERFKVPTERARAVRERLEGALLAYHDVETLAELPGPDADDDGQVPVDTDGDVDADGASTAGPAPSVERFGDVRSLHELGNVGEGPSPLDRLDALADAIETQQDLLDRQRRELDRLREALTPDP